jgi:ketosteroid isomerase-like protein
MSSGGHERLVRDRVEAFNRGDRDAVVAGFDPEIECYVSPELMNAGTWRGIEGFDEMVAGWAEAWGELELRIIELETPDDRHVIARVHQRATGVGSGVPVELDVHFLFEVGDDERTIRLHIYPDRESAMAAVRE